MDNFAILTSRNLRTGGINIAVEHRPEPVTFRFPQLNAAGANYSEALRNLATVIESDNSPEFAPLRKSGK